MEQRTNSGDMAGHGPLGNADSIDARLELGRLRERMFGTASEPVKVGRWMILEKIGMGGMGVVYVAYDPKLDRRVAIKQLLAHRSAQARERFLREARAMAGISHEHVVHVYDVATDGDRAYLVMEYIQGCTLRAWQEEPRPLAEILDAYVQVARRLARIHAEGLIHRDIKPENVFVEEGGRVVVGDLGLARRADLQETSGEAETTDEEPSAMALTAGGALVGTPGYMSPEQLAGDSTDARSDQSWFAAKRRSKSLCPPIY